MDDFDRAAFEFYHDDDVFDSTVLILIKNVESETTAKSRNVVALYVVGS